MTKSDMVITNKNGINEVSGRTISKKAKTPKPFVIKTRIDRPMIELNGDGRLSK